MKIAFVVILIAVVGLGAFFRPWQSSSDAAASTNGESIAVEPQHRDLSSFVLATGIVRPRVGAEVEVGSRVSGILAELHCDVGTRVEAGDLLAELDPAEYEASRKQAAAALENAVADRDYARAAFERRKNLRSKVVSADQIDLAERAYRVGSARVDQAQATLESAEIQLEFTKIVAPIPGVVASVSTQVGETVAASFAAPTFVVIIDLDRLEVWAYVDETDIGRIEVGQEASFKVDTYPQTDFVGRVSAIYPKAEVRDSVVNYIVIVEIVEDHGMVLRPEMTATIRIALETVKDAFCVPSSAIRMDADGAYVTVQDSAGALVRRAVTLGFRNRDFTEVVEGLAPSERVLVTR